MVLMIYLYVLCHVQPVKIFKVRIKNEIKDLVY